MSPILSLSIISSIVLLITIFTPINSKTNCESLPNEITQDIASYAPVVEKIIDYYLNGPFKGKTYDKIADFVDEFGPRAVGSKSLEDSIDYMVTASIQNNLDNVHTEDVNVTAWSRGYEEATLLKPRRKILPIFGLSMSVPAPPEGITASAIVVKSFEELHALSDDKVEGKIVVFDEPYSTYEETRLYTRKGAVEAAKKGAVAALVRSITPFSISSPHVGGVIYENDVKKIPTAALTLEDADFLWREHRRNKEIVIDLRLSSASEEKISHNFISELLGNEKRDNVVLVSGHIDSLDVGAGALDDAGGSFISWLAPIVLKELDLRPKRTIRTVLFTGEEIGIIGAIAYEERHRSENDKLSFVMESDYGTFAPLGIKYKGSEEGECVVGEILKLFQSMNVTQLLSDEPGPDISVFTSQGIPGGGLHTDDGRYFWFHHSEGDNMNVLDPDVMDLNGAFWTAFTYIIADMEYEIPRV